LISERRTQWLVIDDRRHPVIRVDPHEVRFKLVAGSDVDVLDVVENPALFEHDADFPTLGVGQ